MRVLRGMGLFALLLVGAAYVLPHGTSGPTDRIAGLIPLRAAPAPVASQAASQAGSQDAAALAAQAAGVAGQVAGTAVSEVAKAAGAGVLSLVRTMSPRAIDALATLAVRPAGSSKGYSPKAFGVSRDAGRAVALGTAWRSGASGWSATRRAAFARDPLNAAMRGASPCAATARQVAVRSAYGLGVTAAERDALARVLITCPDEPLPE